MFLLALALRSCRHSSGSRAAAWKREVGGRTRDGCVTSCFGPQETLGPSSGMRRKGLCVQQFLLPEQVSILWQLQASVPNIGRSSKSSRPDTC